VGEVGLDMSKLGVLGLRSPPQLGVIKPARRDPLWTHHSLVFAKFPKYFSWLPYVESMVRILC